MDVREKLIELAKPVLTSFPFPWCTAWRDVAEKIADAYIANGVTVQEQDGCDYCQLFDDPCGVPMIAQEESESDRGIYDENTPNLLPFEKLKEAVHNEVEVAVKDMLCEEFGDIANVKVTKTFADLYRTEDKYETD